MTENATPLDSIARFEPTIVEDSYGDPVGEMVKAHRGDWIKFSDAVEFFSETPDLKALAVYLDRMTITGRTIGDIRRSLFHPFDCPWNAAVRDMTAEREQRYPPPKPPKVETYIVKCNYCTFSFPVLMDATAPEKMTTQALAHEKVCPGRAPPEESK